MKFLTIAEEELMFYIWQLGDVVISDLLNKFPEPKPNYNTISTIIKILEKKGYLSHSIKGKNYLYSTLVSKEEYSQVLLSNIITYYFDNDKSTLESYLNNNYDKNTKSYKKLVDSYKQNLNYDNNTQIINRERRVKIVNEVVNEVVNKRVDEPIKKTTGNNKIKNNDNIVVKDSSNKVSIDKDLDLKDSKKKKNDSNINTNSDLNPKVKNVVLKEKILKEKNKKETKVGKKKKKK